MYRAHSKILQNVEKYRSILILFRIAKRSTLRSTLVYNQLATEIQIVFLKVITALNKKNFNNK